MQSDVLLFFAKLTSLFIGGDVMLLKIIEALITIGLILIMLVAVIFYQDPAGNIYMIMLALDEVLLIVAYEIINKHGES
jgi:hypothetical protein